jgi:hypothetical protein
VETNCELKTEKENSVIKLKTFKKDFSNKMGPKRKEKNEGKPDRKKELTDKLKAESAASLTSGDTSSSEEALNSSKYSSRKLNSNWQKYDTDIDLVPEPRGLDFSDFSGQKTSASTDSYFRFSNEKNWEVLEKFDDYFKLNVNDLCREIMCVPLHERLKLELCVLTSEQIEIFNTDAKMYESRMKEPMIPTKEITGKMLSLLSNEIQPDKEKSCTTGWVHKEEQSDNKQQKTWDSNSENFFSLSGVEEELDLILAMPSTVFPSSPHESISLFFYFLILQKLTILHHYMQLFIFSFTHHRRLV